MHPRRFLCQRNARTRPADPIEVGEVVERDGFVFADVLPAASVGRVSGTVYGRWFNAGLLAKS